QEGRGVVVDLAGGPLIAACGGRDGDRRRHGTDARGRYRVQRADVGLRVRNREEAGVAERRAPRVLEVGVGELGETGDVGNQVGLDVPGLGGDGLVVRQGDAGEGDVGAAVEQAAAQGDGAEGAQSRGRVGPAVGDGQVADLHDGRAPADAEDPAGV